MSDQRIQATENMIGANHPTLADTLNRLALVQHGSDGTHGTITGATINLTSNTLVATSAQLKAALTDETGSGAVVFGTNPAIATPSVTGGTFDSPLLTTPILGTPLSGTLSNCTGVPISTGVSGLATGVATFLATPTSANLATALTNETGSAGGGVAVFNNGPTLIAPVLGTPASGTLSSCTGLPVSTGVSGLATGVATFLATPTSANLASVLTDETGTGAAVFGTNPALSGAALTSPTLVTPALGTPTSGTLTSCTGLPVSTGVSGLGSGVATFLATPSSANLALAVTDETGSGPLVFANSPTFSNPTLGQPASGNLSNCTNIPTSGLTGLGTGVGTFLTTPTSANLAAALTDETGTGVAVFNNGPTLITPVLGTPASGNLSNCTALPLGSVTGTGTGVATFLATPTSANLAAALTDETGTGVAVFNNGPTLIAPVLGTPASGALTNCTFPTLNQSTTGSAAFLTTARNINGVAFDGSANIEVEGRVGTPVASGSTTTIGTTGLGESLHITGVTTITSFGTATTGVTRNLVFDGILTLTHNATSLILPNAGSNITTAAGDTAKFLCENGASGYWRCLEYIKVNGQQLANTLTPYAIQQLSPTADFSVNPTSYPFISINPQTACAVDIADGTAVGYTQRFTLEVTQGSTAFTVSINAGSRVSGGTGLYGSGDALPNSGARTTAVFTFEWDGYVWQNIAAVNNATGQQLLSAMPLIKDLVGRKTGSVTFSRAGANVNAVYILDYLGKYQYLSGDTTAAFEGARYVNNILLNSTALSGWVGTNGGVASAPTITANNAVAPDGTTTAHTIVFALNGGSTNAAYSLLSSAVVASGYRQDVASFWAITTDGTSKLVALLSPTTGTVANVTITGTWQMFSIGEASASTAASTFQMRLRGGDGLADSASIAFWHPMIENVTQSLTANPSSEYVATTSLAATSPAYTYLNGNTVSSNVVTQTKGVDLHPFVTENGVQRPLIFDQRAASIGYLAGKRVWATASDGLNYWYTCTTAGFSSGSPTFPTSGTVTDGTAVWTYGGLYRLPRYLTEVTGTNLFLNSDTGVTQSFTVTAQAYTLSFYGTGNIVRSGTSSGTTTGTSASVRTKVTFTPTAGTLTLTVNGSCTQCQMETGSTASSYIATTGSTATRNPTSLYLPVTGNIPSAPWTETDVAILNQTTGLTTIKSWGNTTNGLLLQYTGAVLLLTKYVSSVATYATLTVAPSNNPIKWAVRLNADNTLNLFAQGAKDTGGYGSEIYNPLDLTSGFTTARATVLSANSFYSYGANGWVYKATTHTTGKMYRDTVTATLSSGVYVLRYAFSGNVIRTGDGTADYIADSTSGSMCSIGTNGATITNLTWSSKEIYNNTDTNPLTFGIDRMYFGTDSSGTTGMNGNIMNVRVFPRAYTDTECIAMTTVD